MSGAGEASTAKRTQPGASAAITGIGVITGSGVGVGPFWTALQGDRSPTRIITRFDSSPFRSRIAVEVDDFQAERLMDASRARRLDRFGQFSIGAARLALADADLQPDFVEPNRVAVQLGSALGGIAHAEEQVYRFHERGLRAVDPRLALAVFGGAASCNVAIEFGFTGPNCTNAMSCASGAIGVGEAWRLIREGVVDVAIAGGVEVPLAPLTYGAFANIRAMSTRNDDPEAACRPFDRDRDGFVMGEGAGILVLESIEHASARGARVYATVEGYGRSSDAYHMTAPRPDALQATRAIREALQSARVEPGQIDYVNAHASSTPLNDATETRAIQLALGPRALQIPVSGTKPFYGHVLGASGAIEVAVCALALRHGWVPPTLNLDEPEEGLALDYVPHRGRPRPLQKVLTNSFGFGGVNASLVLACHGNEEEPAPNPTLRRNA